MHASEIMSTTGIFGSNVKMSGSSEIARSHIEALDSGIVEIGNSVLIGCGIVAFDGASVRIADGCNMKGLMVICKGAGSRVEIGHHCNVHADFWGKTVIHCKCGHLIEIGDDCLFSGNIVIRNNDGHPVYDRRYLDGKSDTPVVYNPPMDVHIGNHVWIGEGARILKGVRLGTNTIVGTSAIVTRSSSKDAVGGNVVLGGNPAKVVGNLDGYSWIE